jgi:hypothetical protein
MNGNSCDNCGTRYRNILRICERCGYSEPGLSAQDYAAQDAAAEIRRIDLWETVNHPRLLASSWFAGAGAIPGLLIIGLVSAGGAAPPLIIIGAWIATALIAGVYGATLGARILDATRIGTGPHAFLQGGLVAGFSFVTFIFSISLYLDRQSGPFSFFTAFFALMLYGSLLVGWLVLFIGGLAGWLLFRKYR